MENLDNFLDRVWMLIVSLFTSFSDLFFLFTSLFHPLGGALTISIIAFLAVCLTKFLNRIIITKRFIALEADFKHWHAVREEAGKCEDREKGRRLARNIDQAKLNQAYYDYFFEGLLLGVARKIIPLFFLFAFINETYRSERLEELFGHHYVIALPSTNGEPLLIGAVFWFILSVFFWYLVWYLFFKFFPASGKKNKI